MLVAPQTIDPGRPGQQLVPVHVAKLLKTLKIPFGTDRTMNGVDVDPTIGLISHIGCYYFYFINYWCYVHKFLL